MSSDVDESGRVAQGFRGGISPPVIKGGLFVTKIEIVSSDFTAAFCTDINVVNWYEVVVAEVV